MVCPPNLQTLLPMVDVPSLLDYARVAQNQVSVSDDGVDGVLFA